jgi:Txe/YoeB family toxin of Txe-Axe toxin-antitoxin module
MGRTTREPVAVEVGQIWFQPHKRRPRHFRVIKVGGAYALVDPWEDYSYPTWRSRHMVTPTRILLRRLQTSAYRFTGKVVEVEDDAYTGEWSTEDLDREHP